MNPFEQKLKELVDKVVENNLWRQRRCFNLIPSENTPSLLVKLCEISDPSGRYAEHKTALKKEREALAGSGALKGDQVYYYQATDFIYEVEENLKQEFGRFLGATAVEARPVSGQMANEIVFKAMVKFLAAGPEGYPRLSEGGRLMCVMNNNLNYGGHLSAQPFGALFNFVEKDAVVNFPLQAGNPYKIDVGRMLELLSEHRPPLVVFGKSMFLHPEPVRELRQHVASLPGYHPVVMYDGAHGMGVLGAHFQEPLAEGADVVTGSTHKTFFGPQRGIIASRMNEDPALAKLWREVNARSFPGSTSNHHLGTLLAMLAATIEMNQFKDDYQRQVLANARAFAKACADKGIPVEGGESDGFTHTPQVVIRVKPFGDAKEVATRLEQNNIITNYQALPDAETFYHPSGIRMGVSEMTRFGMKESDFGKLAGYLARGIIDRKDIAGEVAEFRGQFSTMGYCLDPEATLRLAPAIFKSLFPKDAYFQSFAAALGQA